MKDLSTILIFTFVANVVSLEETLLHYVQDDVPGGSYKYYSLMYEGVIKIRLTSQFGDSDIYVSQTTTKPTYEPDNYCLQSTTCGEDILYIPQSFKRPVSIGVYGHPSHENSHYTLSVYQIELADGDTFDEQNPTESFRKKDHPKRASFVVALLWTLIDVLFQVLF